MEVVAHAPPRRTRRDPRRRARARRRASRRAAPGRERPRELQPLDDDRQVARITEEAALDDGQPGRVARPEPDTTRRPGLHMEARRRSPRNPVRSPSSTQESTWRSQAAAAQTLLAALTNACGRKSGPVRATCSAVIAIESLGRAPIGSPCRDGRAAARPRAGLPRSGSPCRASSSSGPMPLPQQDRGREVGARREHDDVGVDPLARGGDARRSRAPRPGPAIDGRVGADDEVRPASRRVEVREAPCSSGSRRRRSPAARHADRLAKDRPGRRARRTRHLAPPRGTRRGAAPAPRCWPGATRSVSRARRR